MNRSPLIRALLVSAALGATVALSGCNTDLSILPMSEKAARPLSDKMVKEIQSKNMDMESPILVRLFKEESELEIWKQNRDGRFALLKTYPICRWSGELGPKIKEGDRQAPEGFYSITPGQMNPNSQYYLSFDLGYPNAFDRAHGRTGAQLMVHGDCSSRGCYSMTDEQISEIYALGRDSFFGGQKSFQVQAYPFRMTAQNLAKHRNSPHLAFWKMLKKGNDHFEVSKLEPKVNVCDKRYVFDAAVAGRTRAVVQREPRKCPAYEVPEEIASAGARQRTPGRAPIRRSEPPQYSSRSDQDQCRRRHASGVRRSSEEEPARRRAAGIDASWSRRRLEPFRPRCGHRASLSLPMHQLSRAPRLTPTVSRRGRASRDGHCRDQANGPTGRDSRAAATCSAVCSLRKRRAKAENEERRHRSIAWRAWSAWRKEGHQEAANATPAPVPKPKPAVKPTSVASNGAIRAKQAEAQPVKTTEAQAPAPGAVTPAVAAPASTAMNGAAPVVPTGTFDNRWSGFR